MSDKRCIVLACQGTGCISAGGEEIYQQLLRLVSTEGIRIKRTGCHGFCQQGPLIIIEPEGILYTKVKMDNIAEIIQSLLPEGTPVEHLFYRDPITNKPIPTYHDIPFYSKQKRTVLRNCGNIDPEDINDYIAVGGYQALKKAIFEMSPEEVISEVKLSGLRGRGGAGFPTGLKWEICSQVQSNVKYIICNGDEGDPGAFMDRAIMEADPHAVIEGMIIAAKAIGANSGYIYVRAEYPLAVNRLQIAIKQCYEAGLLGKDILGSGFDFDLEIYQGAGAFVCGEETALMRSIEGRRGMPRPRPPFPAHKGLWGKPTIINNVETLAQVPLIILNGKEWYRAVGTEKSPGTKVFALTGAVNNIGLIEVPMGMTLREIIYGIGGGIKRGRKFKAVQIGGPSGGCIPEEFLDIAVTFEDIVQTGAIMGSGGMVVMDEDTCMVDVARYFVDFTQRESCGQCIPCRVGTRQMFQILDDITKGEGRTEDIDLLMELGEAIKKSSICGLGKTAPNPVLTTIRYFRNEYKAHIYEKRCPAGVCNME